jgi:hypothetical protein
VTIKPILILGVYLLTRTACLWMTLLNFLFFNNRSGDDGSVRDGEAGVPKEAC